ncbi:dihydropteroate synthase [Planctomycetota bacterium]|nr:dihydropteroate synthase [Planctomycetota bacterium]
MEIDSQQLIDRSRKLLPRIMGVLNVTPDSFSDGGWYNVPEAGAKHALEMARDGASIIDIGGESTRPGAERIGEAEQIERTAPVIEAVRKILNEHHFDDVVISIDTTLSPVAKAALDAGAGFINDVSGGTEDVEIIGLAAEREVPLCLMHMQGEPGNMQQNPTYENATEEVLGYLLDRANLAMSAGCEASNIYLDPGIGFGKTVAHNLDLLANLEKFTSTSFPVLLGTSRKSLFYAISPTTAKLPTNREMATAVTSALAVQTGVSIIRVHNVAANLQAIQTAAAIMEAGA